MDAPEEQEARAQADIHEAIARHAEDIGPWETDEEDEPIPDQPIPGALLSEWVVVMSWVDPKDGRSHVTTLTSPNLPPHHEDGLLHQALFRLD